MKKILPQCQYTQYWYDHGDKVIFMQDANLRSKNKYRFLLYDRLGRLCVQGLCDSFDRSANVSNGNIEHMQRRGRKQDGHVGKIDNLSIFHHGNQLSSVVDDAAKIYYAGIFNFNGDGKNEAHYKYNDSGSLIEDEARGISLIEYDAWGNPRRIQFANGNVTEYVFTATGTKLRTVHYTAVPNISVPAGTTHRLSTSEILSKDSTDYHGNLIIENGKPDKYLFAGGFASLRNSADGKPEIAFHYYDQDHLGNNRAVVSARTGSVEQITNYYPFGMPYTDQTAVNPDFQKYKYNGKELDKMHGLNTYYYGARQYYSIMPAWDRIDPMCEKYYSVSPYVYCEGNPINAIDHEGKFPYYLQAMIVKASYNGNPDIYTSPIQENPRTKNPYLRYTFNTVTPDGNGGVIVTNVSRAKVGLFGKAQDFGTAVAIGGYALTLTGVGAEIGAPIAAIGNTINDVGTVGQIGFDIINGDFGISDEVGLAFGIGVFFLDKLINKVIPGVEAPSFKEIVKELYNGLLKNGNMELRNDFDLGKEILSQGASLKMQFLEETTKKAMEHEGKSSENNVLKEAGPNNK